MKAILVIDIPNEYAHRYNVNEMYVWNLVVQDKQGYQMFDLTTDKPSHLKLLPEKKYLPQPSRDYWFIQEGRNQMIDEIIGETEQ